MNHSYASQLKEKKKSFESNFYHKFIYIQIEERDISITSPNLKMDQNLFVLKVIPLHKKVKPPCSHSGSAPNQWGNAGSGTPLPLICARLGPHSKWNTDGVPKPSPNTKFTMPQPVETLKKTGDQRNRFYKNFTPFSTSTKRFKLPSNMIIENW